MTASAARRNRIATTLLNAVRLVPRCDRCQSGLNGQPRCGANGDTVCLACYREENLADADSGPCANCGVETNERDCEGVRCHTLPCTPVDTYACPTCGAACEILEDDGPYDSGPTRFGISCDPDTGCGESRELTRAELREAGIER